jgi:hypothetical protein
MQSAHSNTISVRLILILSSHLCLPISSKFPLSFSFSQFFHACFMPNQFVILSFITLILCEEYKLWSTPLWNFLLQSCYFCFQLSSNILLSTLFSNTHNLYSSLNRRKVWKYAKISLSSNKDILICMCRCKTIYFQLMPKTNNVFMAPVSCILWY